MAISHALRQFNLEQICDNCHRPKSEHVQVIEGWNVFNMCPDSFYHFTQGAPLLRREIDYHDEGPDFEVER